MPANLTPEYLAAQQDYKSAKEAAGFRHAEGALATLSTRGVRQCILHGCAAPSSDRPLQTQHIFKTLQLLYQRLMIDLAQPFQ